MVPWLSEFRQAARRLRRRPTYSILAVATLALGVAGAAAIAGISRPLLLDALPYPDAEQLVRMWNPGDWRPREIATLRGQWPGFTSVAAYHAKDLTLERDGTPTRLVPGIASTIELFDVLGVSPALGRGFSRGEDTPGAGPVAVLSNNLWRDLGRDEHVVGSSVRLDGIVHTVIGVMPPGFWFPDPSIRVWTNDTINSTGQIGLYTLVGRMEPGRRVDAMGSALERVTRLLRSRFTYEPQWDITRDPTLTSFRDWIIGPLRPALIATSAGLIIILLIACANVAALVLGQIEARTGELAVRTALGADRSRLVAQLFAEVLLIGAAASVVGAALAPLGFRLLHASLPLGVWSARPSLDWTVFALVIGGSVMTAIAVAIIPAFTLWHADVRDALGGVRSGAAPRQSRLQSIMVATEVSLAVLLACFAGLVGRSVENLYAIDPGIETNHVAVIDVAAPTGSTDGERLAMLRESMQRIASLPGVRSVATTQMLPLRARAFTMGLRLPDIPADARTPFFRMVSRDYFAALGIRLVRGRLFAASDAPRDSIKSIIVNERLVQIYFPRTNPIGQVLRGGFGGSERIVGVVADASEGELTDRDAPVRYYLDEQLPWVPPQHSIVIRMRGGDPTTILPIVRKIIATAAPALAVFETTTMGHVLARAVGPARDVVALLAALTALAITLGAIGIYGVVSQFVGRRMREWSIRIALGLAPWRVVRLILSRSIAVVVVGIALGIVASVVANRMIASLLFGVAPTDPIAIVAAISALALTGLAASLVPALRAARSDPARVLREQ